MRRVDRSDLERLYRPAIGVFGRVIDAGMRVGMLELVDERDHPDAGVCL